MCGPSGCGKSTVIKKLMAKHPEKFGFSVSHTTRKPRPGEVDGISYNFTSHKELEKGRNAGLFLETAEVTIFLFIFEKTFMVCLGF